MLTAVACEPRSAPAEKSATTELQALPQAAADASGAAPTGPTSAGTADATDTIAARAPAPEAPSPRPAPSKDVAPTTLPPLPADVAKHTFTVALSYKPNSFDPAIITDAQSAQLAFNTFEGLMTFDITSGPVVPGVAERYEVSDEGRVYTFHLRPNARWSNGDPLTAYDFEYAWKRVLDPATGSRYAWVMTDVARIVGAKAYHGAQGTADQVGVVALDSHRLRVTLEMPVPEFVELTAMFTFAPFHQPALAQWGPQWSKPEHWVSNGAYVLESVTDELSYVLRKNPLYWDADAVGIERVVLRVIEDDAGRIHAYDAGLIDWTGPRSLPVNTVQGARHAEVLHKDPYLAVDYIVFNTRVEPFDNPLAREAIALAIDNARVVEEALGGFGNAARGFVPPLPDFRSQVGPRFDPELARKTLARAGFAGGEGLPSLTYAFPKGSTDARLVAENVQKQLQEHLELEVTLQGLEYDLLQEALNKGEFLMARVGWLGDYMGASTFLGLWATSSQQNYAGWSHEQYDDLLDQASHKVDLAERNWMYRQAELLLDRELPISPLFYGEQTYLLRPSFKGIEPHLLSVHLFKYVSTQ